MAACPWALVLQCRRAPLCPGWSSAHRDSPALAPQLGYRSQLGRLRLELQHLSQSGPLWWYWWSSRPQWWGNWGWRLIPLPWGTSRELCRYLWRPWSGCLCSSCCIGITYSRHSLCCRPSLGRLLPWDQYDPNPMSGPRVSFGCVLSRVV